MLTVVAAVDGGGVAVQLVESPVLGWTLLSEDIADGVLLLSVEDGAVVTAADSTPLLLGMSDVEEFSVLLDIRFIPFAFSSDRKSERK